MKKAASLSRETEVPGSRAVEDCSGAEGEMGKRIGEGKSLRSMSATGAFQHGIVTLASFENDE